MNEDLPPVIRGDETEALLIAELLHCTLCHCTTPELVYGHACPRSAEKRLLFYPGMKGKIIEGFNAQSVWRHSAGYAPSVNRFN